ncbi:MAG: serine/threonine-protein kinase [Polyangiales bacterium]
MTNEVLRPGDVVLRRFRVEGLAGRGGLAEVFRALDVGTGEAVAVKVPRRALAGEGSAAARFLREARVARRVVHPAVPACVAVGVLPTGSPALVTRFVEGETLHARIARGPLDVPDALRIAARVAEALDAAHALGVVHRDVTPGNVLLAAGEALPDAVRVVDFGLAFVLDEPRLSATHAALGTSEYLPPEQCRGERVTPAADLYALGATLAHALTGHTLFSGDPARQRAAHVAEAPPDLAARRPDLPRAVADYVASLVRKRPAERPPSAAAVARDLRRLADGLVPSPEALSSEVREALQSASERAAAARARVATELAALGAARGDAAVSPAEAALERAIERIEAACAEERRAIAAGGVTSR